jgi:hypothetical protein
MYLAAMINLVQFCFLLVVEAKSSPLESESMMQCLLHE